MIDRILQDNSNDQIQPLGRRKSSSSIHQIPTIEVYVHLLINYITREQHARNLEKTIMYITNKAKHFIVNDEMQMNYATRNARIVVDEGDREY